MFRHALDAFQVAAKHCHRRLPDVGLGGLACGELARPEDVGKGRMYRVVHPGEDGHRLGALPWFGRQQPGLGIAPVEIVADRHDLAQRLAIDQQQRHLAAGVERQVFG